MLHNGIFSMFKRSFADQRHNRLASIQLHNRLASTDITTHLYCDSDFTIHTVVTIEIVPKCSM